jgi:hypothetical protein
LVVEARRTPGRLEQVETNRDTTVAE